MTGTEKILLHISDQAKNEAQAILEEARAEIAGLEKEAAGVREEILSQAQKQGDALLADARERAQVSAATYKRRTLLAVRGALVKEALNKAFENILALPETEYFDFLYNQLEKQSLNRSGALCLNQRDLARRPSDFEKRIAAIAKKQGGKLTLDENPAAITGGFILQYGGIEENCSIEAIFDSESDVLKDAIRAVLFEN